MLKLWLTAKFNLNYFIIVSLLFVIISVSSFSQNKLNPIAKISNDEIRISLIKLHPFLSSNTKSGNKFLVAEILIENISDKVINMGADYSMSIIIIDSEGKEYKSGLKGAGIVSEFLTKFPDIEQDQKAYNLAFSDKFPAKSKAQSFLCGYEVPVDAQIVKFGVKKKNLFSDLKSK